MLSPDSLAASLQWSKGESRGGDVHGTEFSNFFLCDYETLYNLYHKTIANYIQVYFEKNDRAGRFDYGT